MPIREYVQQHKRFVIAGIAIVGLLVIAGWAYKGRSNQPSYLTAPVTRGDISAVVQATGTINPLTTVPVGSYV